MSTRIAQRDHLDPLLLLAIVVLLRMGMASSLPCSPDQAAALLQLKRSFTATSASATAFRSWRAGTDCCRWASVRCDGGGRVTSLDLGGRRLRSGGLDPAVFSLTSLRRLSLGGNNFSGSRLPAAGFERLTELTHLNISPPFSGQIPAGIGLLTNLVSLDLSSRIYIVNQGDGVNVMSNLYPAWGFSRVNFEKLISNLGNLRELYLGLVYMSNGDERWCQALANSTPKIQVLSLPLCKISGPICQSLFRLRSLSVINLQRNHLSGPIPESFADLPSLSVLQLSRNQFEGLFPTRIFKNRKLTTISYNYEIYGSLPNFPPNSSLIKLHVSGTKFSGFIPSSISNITGLKELGLSENDFSTELPSSLGMLTSLNLFEVSGLGLVGSMPTWITNLTSLTELQFSHCDLSGPLPSSIDNLKNLRRLSIFKSNFSGNIPLQIFNLTQLQILELVQNNFMGTVELTSFWGLPYLKHLGLSNNKLSVVDGLVNDSAASSPRVASLMLASCKISTFPNALRHQDNIDLLDLSNNQMGGAIPSWVWETWKELFFLDLSNNKFTSLGHDTLLPLYTRYINLSYNMFEGPIPIPKGCTDSLLDYSNNRFSSMPFDLIPYLAGTLSLMVSRNNVSGEIPSTFCAVKSLQILDLSNNIINGSIPSCLMENSSTLKILNLKANQLHGELPHNIKEHCAFEALDFSHNWIEGKLPTSLVACKNLMILDIGNNQIGGYFPCWMHLLPKLQVLVLKSNKFYGQLGPTLAKDESSCELQDLRILDLASNNFSGILPGEWFSKLKSMMLVSTNETLVMKDADTYSTFYRTPYFFPTTVTYKGLYMAFTKIFNTLVLIDVSNNKFHGSIPETIGMLSALSGLNMSHNALTGPIPNQLGSLHQLESLDLSSNKLSGEIPQNLAFLDFLSTLNLSNNMEGRIPESPHFSSLPNSSFIRNVGLCGPPL
uniref:non-specific serine/threonine protein kinase n=1 Tax=Oryza brachyantha TaxID=4533 RepID=J3KWM7_ORYBR